MVLGEACDDVPNPLHQWDIPLSYANKPIVADERTPKVIYLTKNVFCYTRICFL